MRTTVYRPFWLPAAVTMGVLIAVFGCLAFMSWRSVASLDPIHEHLEHLELLHETGLGVQMALLEGMRREARVDPARVRAARASVEELIALKGHMEPQTPERLRAMQARFNDLERDPLGSTLAIMELMRETRAYVDIHTKSHPDGELRAQLEVIRFEDRSGYHCS